MIALILFFLAILFYFLGKKELSLLLFLCFPTCGFQIIPFSLMALPEIGLTKTYDLGIIFLIIILVIEHKKIFKILGWKKHNELLILFILATMAFIVSVLVYHYAITTALRPYRGYIFLLSFLLFELYSFKNLTWLFKAIVYITAIQGVLYVLQNPLGVSLLNSGVVDRIEAKEISGFEGFTRYYNLPVFLIPSLFYCLFFSKQFTKSILYLCLIAFFLVIILSLHRNLLFSTILIIFFTILKSASAKKVINYIIIGAIAMLTASIFLEDRIDEGLNDLQEITHFGFDSDDVNLNYDIKSQNTSLFRTAHFLERFQYISDDATRLIFGIGYLTEDAPQAQSLRFNIGLRDKISKEVIQVETGDIIWSTLILQRGIIGALLFLFLIIKFILKQYKNFIYPYAKLCFCYTTVLLLISFYTVDLLSIHFNVLISLIAVLARKEKVYFALDNQKRIVPKLSISYANNIL